MGDKTRGLYDKFKVERTDGTSAPGGKHDGCQYFVLDVSHDPYAAAALIAYANGAEAEYPLLARDVRKMAQRVCDHDWVETLRGPDTVGQHCAICDVDQEPDYGDDY